MRKQNVIYKVFKDSEARKLYTYNRRLYEIKEHRRNSEVFSPRLVTV